jgi:hypothetical protein
MKTIWNLRSRMLVIVGLMGLVACGATRPSITPDDPLMSQRTPTQRTTVVAAAVAPGQSLR